MKIFNEPGDPRESWGSYENFAAKWNERAAAVVDEGGYPGLQVLDCEAMKIAVSGMSPAVAENFYFSLHNYGANHPPVYPFPPEQPKVGYRVPGGSGAEPVDDTCVLRFLEFAECFRRHLGKIPPMLGSEGGWLYGNHDNDTRPAVEGATWRLWTWEMFDWFRTGKLSNGALLPDYLFNIAPWVLHDPKWGGDSWIDGNNEAQIAPFRSMLETTTPFTRQFGETSMPPPEPNETLQDAVLKRVNATNLMPVNEDAALYKFAVAKELGFQQSDELQLSYRGETYVAQAFHKGIVYARMGDWGNIKLIRK